ncbi:MAG: hypothetical protein QOF73_1036 [Thermomicrobiales bacterium]|nr:hypothetical protein [Thermomicrobiales bacterium]
MAGRNTRMRSPVRVNCSLSQVTSERPSRSASAVSTASAPLKRKRRGVLRCEYRKLSIQLDKDDRRIREYRRYGLVAE